MLNIPYIGRGLVRCSSHYSLRLMGLAAVALLTLSVGSSERAQAMSLINPGAAAAAKVAADGLTIEVHGGGHGGGGGGGHGFGGGGHGFGGGAFHGGGFRAGPMVSGGGARYGGFRHGGQRFGHRHHFGRFFAGGFYYDDYPYDDYPYYDYPAYYAYPGCRIVVTAYGPRRICGYHHWRHHHYRHHHYRRHHRVYR